MTGTVATFYSFKGGVGRSFALANIAIILAQWGHRVLAVDWDLEAPGLDHFFGDLTTKRTAGVLGFLDDCARGKRRAWYDYATEVSLPDCPNRLFLMPASSNRGDDYFRDIQAINWNELFERSKLGRRLEELRSDWVENFDIVLIDSRTGITDFSGITTVQLPDILAFLFVANSQSFYGACDVVTRAMRARRRIALDRPALVPLPIPSKFDRNEEYDRAQIWRDRFAKALSPFLSIWAPPGTNATDLVDLLTVPYVPRWSFGEDAAALIEPANASGIRTSASPTTYALETVAALLSSRFSGVDLLTSSRDEFVLSARAQAKERRKKSLPSRHSVFVSYHHSDEAIAREVQRLLEEVGVNVLDIGSEVAQSPESVDYIQDALEQADALIAIVGGAFDRSPRLPQEVQHFLRHGLRTGRIKSVIPLLIESDLMIPVVNELMNFQAYKVDPDRALRPQLAPVIRRIIEDQADPD